MKKIAFTVMIVFSSFAQAGEFKFTWVGNIPTVTTYINETISYHPAFNINDYNSLTLINHNMETDNNIKLITLSVF
ncbi:hypothetical protein [Vibrio harveyi]|nr:hypothetical protein [Vibrio harveyi]EKO3867504.1 hypothetical protein [Vibrio harveyi]ELI0635248.1 hypothetical protein [Vibrio harveyi]